MLNFITGNLGKVIGKALIDIAIAVIVNKVTKKYKN